MSKTGRPSYRRQKQRPSKLFKTHAQKTRTYKSFMEESDVELWLDELEPGTDRLLRQLALTRAPSSDEGWGAEY